jgi:hypothetical protein
MAADGLRLLQDLRSSQLAARSARQLPPRTGAASQDDGTPQSVSAIA